MRSSSCKVNRINWEHLCISKKVILATLQWHIHNKTPNQKVVIRCLMDQKLIASPLKAFKRPGNLN